MREWSVYVEMPGTGRYDKSTVDGLVEALKPWHASIGTSGRVLGVTVTVVAASPPRALQEALAVVKAAVRTVLPQELITAEVQPMDALHEGLPARLSLIEIAAFLGVSKQRVSQLRERPDFPPPSERLATGPVWRRATIVAFNREWKRRKGRPPKSPPQPDA